MQPIRACLADARLRRLIHQIAIRIVFYDEPARIVPVIEDLTAHDMAAHAPAILPPLLPQPVVAQHLHVEVVDLETTVMDVPFGTLEDEEGVVVDEFFAAVEMHEGGGVATSLVVEEFGSFEVEVRGVKVVGSLEVGYAVAEMAHLVDRGRTFLKSLGLVDGPVLGIWLHKKEC